MRIRPEHMNSMSRSMCRWHGTFIHGIIQSLPMSAQEYSHQFKHMRKCWATAFTCLVFAMWQQITIQQSISGGCCRQNTADVVARGQQFWQIFHQSVTNKCIVLLNEIIAKKARSNRTVFSLRLNDLGIIGLRRMQAGDAEVSASISVCIGSLLA